MEYQHYIPQFILRNFSHKFSPPRVNGSKRPYRRAKDKKTGLYPGDPALNILRLDDETLEVLESPVRRTFGMMDMYKDVLNTANQNFLEKELGKLEARASKIIAGIKKALESGQNGFAMPRDEKDVLRKFLSIMKFRGRGFQQRFAGDESGVYVEDDAVQFNAYMKEKGIKRPVDVWFKTLKCILEMKMDITGKWKQMLMSETYPDDAIWFIVHMEFYFVAFVTPDDPQTEFVLTENSYNVHEGPNSSILNTETGLYEVTAWTSYHEFSPITPRLMLVLRSFLVPYPEEDVDGKIRALRMQMIRMSSSRHTDPIKCKSIFEDLPITKPRNSYTTNTTAGLEYLPGEDGTRKPHHHFTFPFFKISTDQAQRINTILLDNAYNTSTIAFESGTSLRDTLEYYFKYPPDGGSKTVVAGDAKDKRLALLNKLQTFLTSLGSSVKFVHRTIPNLEEYSKQQAISKRDFALFKQEMINALPEKPSEFMVLYYALGGVAATMIDDIEQAGKMRTLRIKIDVCTHRFSEATRQGIRDNLRDLFCSSIPPQRVWLYLKSIRIMALGSPESLHVLMSSSHAMDGPEDVLAKMNHIVRPECLNLLLYFTVLQDIEHRKTPGVTPSSSYSFDEAGAELLHRITQLAFAPVGSIKDCGILPLQNSAIGVMSMLRRTKLYESLSNPVWSVEQNIEILTRAALRKDFASIMAGSKVSSEGLCELRDVLFGIVYPTYIKLES